MTYSPLVLLHCAVKGMSWVTVLAAPWSTKWATSASLSTVSSCSLHQVLISHQAVKWHEVTMIGKDWKNLYLKIKEWTDNVREKWLLLWRFIPFGFLLTHVPSPTEEVNHLVWLASNHHITVRPDRARLTFVLLLCACSSQLTHQSLLCLVGRKPGDNHDNNNNGRFERSMTTNRWNFLHAHYTQGCIVFTKQSEADLFF